MLPDNRITISLDSHSPGESAAARSPALNTASTSGHPSMPRYRGYGHMATRLLLQRWQTPLTEIRSSRRKPTEHSASCRMRQAGSLCFPMLHPLQSETAKSRIENTIARVAELADAPDLGSGAERRAGSSPVSGITCCFWAAASPLLYNYCR
jgi:hypothetical protein